MKRTGGGTWDPTAWPMYFVAAEVNTLTTVKHHVDNMLVAVNELDSPAQQQCARDFLDMGHRLFLDSGVYNLATEHAEHHGLTMDQALGMPPDQIDGFTSLFDRYVALVKELGPRLWGYIEIDQGGRDNKIKTRARLEALGLAPIPVYHPVNDGWDYFDELASQYDRICFGNIVNSADNDRKRLIATAWERRRRFPHLWIHALGMTPSATTNAFPINSCDSSAWISGVRWGRVKSYVANGAVFGMGVPFTYDLLEDADAPRGHMKARRMAAVEAHIMNMHLARITDDQRRVLGADPALATKGKTRGPLATRPAPVA